MPTVGPSGPPAPIRFEPSKPRESGDISSDLARVKEQYDDAIFHSGKLDQIQGSSGQLVATLLNSREKIEKSFVGEPSELAPHFDAVIETNDQIQQLSEAGGSALARAALISDHSSNIQTLLHTIDPSAYLPPDMPDDPSDAGSFMP